MPRIDKYRGKEKDALASLTAEEFLPMLTSRARRALKRAASNKNMAVRKFMKKVSAIKAKNPAKVIKTHVREAVIVPEWLGLTFAVHNGKEWKSVLVSVDKLGYRLGRLLPHHRARAPLRPWSRGNPRLEVHPAQVR